MNQYYQVRIPVTSAQEAELLIAQLSDMDFYAFEEEKEALLAYIKKKDFESPGLLKTFLTGIPYTKTLIDEENWNEKWESGIEPVIIGDFVAIRPGFHPPVPGVKYDVVITPKMSFGTGHHATTALMIGAMEKINFYGKEVIDFGTGTGVLAIVAEKCGAKKIVAVDNDEWSISNAIENIAANQCEKIFVVKKNDLESLDTTDIIVANINFNVLSRNAAHISSLLKKDSFLLVSGFLRADEEKMQNIFIKNSVYPMNITNEGEWSAVLFQKR